MLDDLVSAATVTGDYFDPTDGSWYWTLSPDLV